jgi:hypothetical protein
VPAQAIVTQHIGVVCGRGRNTTLSNRAVYPSDPDNFPTIGIFGRVSPHNSRWIVSL